MKFSGDDENDTVPGIKNMTKAHSHHQCIWKKQNINMSGSIIPLTLAAINLGETNNQAQYDHVLLCI
jgi:hypothetical protein